VRQLLFNKNVCLFVKMTLKIANNTADNSPYTARNRVASIQLGRHSAVLAILKAKILNNFKEIISSTAAIFIKQHSITVMV